MKNKLGLVVTIATLFCTCLLSTMFFFAVYNSYFDTPYEDFAGIFITPSTDEPDLSPQGQRRLQKILKDIDAWAKQEGAAIFYFNGSGGVGVLDYANLFQNALQVDFNGQEAKTVLIRQPLASWGELVQEGILFPGVYDYKVLGEYDPQAAPLVNLDTSFFYPLQDTRDLNGVFYLSVQDKNAIFDFIRLFEGSPYKAEFINYKDQHMGLGQILLGMMQTGSISRSLLCTFLAILFCAAFALSMFYKERYRYLVVHHLYGASYRILSTKLFLLSSFIAMLGTLLGYVLVKAQLYMYNPSAYGKIGLLSGALNLGFLTLLQISFFWQWRQKRKKVVGEY